jgi:hypothetical protein
MLSMQEIIVLSKGGLEVSHCGIELDPEIACAARGGYRARRASSDQRPAPTIKR